jgi:hypothetical protein
MTEINDWRDLDALEDGSVVLDVNGEARQTFRGMWYHCGAGAPYDSDQVMEFGPFQLLGPVEGSQV